MNNKSEFEYKYLMYKAKYLNLKKQKNMKGGSAKKVDIILFKADWCGHCVNFKPTWEKVSKTFSSKFNFLKYDADNDTKVFEKYKVDSFPTILIQDGDIVRPYDGDRSVEQLTMFLTNLEAI
jgi:thioredoxin-like negative regulator of GroEL